MTNYTKLKGLFLLLVLGSIGCSKREVPEANLSSEPVSLLGSWTAGVFSHSEKKIADTTPGITTTSPMAFANWTFNLDGTVSLSSDGRSVPMTYAVLSENRVILSLMNASDTFQVQSKGVNAIQLMGSKNVNGLILTETLDLTRSGN
jgi:hypothetical protein